MSKIIKITDIESGVELEIKKTQSEEDVCNECFYNNSNKCHYRELPCIGQDIIFKEVTEKQQGNEKG